AFARALDLPLEGGRLAFQKPTLPAVDDTLVHSAKTSVKEARREMARLLRGQLAALEHRTLEEACVPMLHALGYREGRGVKGPHPGPAAHRPPQGWKPRAALRHPRAARQWGDRPSPGPGLPAGRRPAVGTGGNAPRNRGSPGRRPLRGPLGRP